MMKIFNYKEVVAEEVVDEGASGVKVRWVISQKDGAENFYMRIFEIEPQGFTPYHQHPWEHEIFIKEGQGLVVTSEGEKGFQEGDVIFVKPEEFHQFKNSGQRKLELICLVPSKAKYS